MSDKLFKLGFVVYLVTGHIVYKLDELVQKYCLLARFLTDTCGIVANDNSEGGADGKFKACGAVDKCAYGCEGYNSSGMSAGHTSVTDETVEGKFFINDGVYNGCNVGYPCAQLFRFFERARSRAVYATHSLY